MDFIARRLWLCVCICLSFGSFYNLTFICNLPERGRNGADSNEKESPRSPLENVRTSTSAELQTEAARGLTERLLGKERAALFAISVDFELGPRRDRDTFRIRKNAIGKIEINATSGVAATWGLHYYLKHHCNAHVAWEGSQLELPSVLPNVDVTVTSNDKYYQNVCEAGYTTVWWQWKQWERHIDWVALNGFNLVLSFHGQEAIWEKVYLDLNLTREEIGEHFGGPAFLPWTRMGNIRGFGGPLKASWHEHTIRLQRNVLRRMRDLGIVPVLPTFAGHVPRAFSRVFPKANLTKVDVWNHFGDEYCCPYTLDPSDPLFEPIGRRFLKQYIEAFGTDHVYNCDTFNENKPHSGEPDALRSFARTIYSVMTDVDSDAVWLMQGWLFYHDIEFWTEPRVEAVLTAVPIGRMIILDLQSEQFPQYNRLRSYYGQPFIWCMLHNFGGTLGMFGSAEIVNQRVFEARNMEGSSMVGTGLTPEGINQNYVIYELMNEMAYRKAPIPDLDDWFENYATRRYGRPNEHAAEAWRQMGRTLYNFKGLKRIKGHYVITRRPSLKILPWTWYDREIVLSAWSAILKARHEMRNSTLYSHDVVDLTRQALQIIADLLYPNLVDAFTKKNVTALKSDVTLLLDLFDDIELVLASGENFLLGRWIDDAKAVAADNETRASYEYNARNQITLWGPTGEIVDYANKQWSGVFADYFGPRWSIFLSALVDSLVNGTTFNESVVKKNMFEKVERPFTFSKKVYPREPRGDSVRIAEALNKKWTEIAVGLIRKSSVKQDFSKNITASTFVSPRENDS